MSGPRTDVSTADVVAAVLDHGSRIHPAALALGVTREMVRGRLRQIARLSPSNTIPDHQLVQLALTAWERSQPTDDEVIPSTSTEVPKGWRTHAACLSEDPELFFPIGNTGPALLQIEEAKAVCRRCDVVAICLRWALDTGQDHGVWGGLTEDERRALKRRNQRARRAS